MRIRILLSVALVVSVGLSASVGAQKTQKATHIPVISEILTADSGVAPSLHIQNDGKGVYINSSTQTSMIFTNGDWRLDAYYLADSAPARRVWLSFDQPVVPGTVGPAAGFYKVNMGSNCSNFGNNMQTMVAGQTFPCPMNVHFDSGGKTYNLRMNHLTYPGTNPNNVTCIFPASGPCSMWRLQPSGSYTYTDVSGVEKNGLRNVARLSYETTVRGKIVDVTVGNFYISYSIIVTKP